MFLADMKDVRVRPDGRKQRFLTDANPDSVTPQRLVMESICFIGTSTFGDLEVNAG